MCVYIVGILSFPFAAQRLENLKKCKQTENFHDTSHNKTLNMNKEKEILSS